MATPAAPADAATETEAAVDAEAAVDPADTAETAAAAVDAAAPLDAVLPDLPDESWNCIGVKKDINTVKTSRAHCLVCCTPILRGTLYLDYRNKQSLAFEDQRRIHATAECALKLPMRTRGRDILILRRLYASLAAGSSESAAIQPIVSELMSQS